MSVDKYFDWAERCALDVRFRQADGCNECLCAHFESDMAKPLQKDWLLDGGRQAQRLPRGSHMGGMRLGAWVMEDRTEVDTPGMEAIVVEPESPSSERSSVLPPLLDPMSSPKLLPRPLEKEEEEEGGNAIMEDETSSSYSSPVSPALASLRGGKKVEMSGGGASVWMYATAVIAFIAVAVIATKMIRLCSGRWFSRQERPSKAPKPDTERQSEKKTKTTTRPSPVSKVRASADQTIASLGQERGLQREGGRQARETTMMARRRYQ